MPKNDELLELFLNLTVTIRENMIRCARIDIRDLVDKAANMPESEIKDAISDTINKMTRLISIAKYQSNFTAILSIVERYRNLKEKKDQITIDLQTRTEV